MVFGYTERVVKSDFLFGKYLFFLKHAQHVLIYNFIEVPLFFLARWGFKRNSPNAYILIYGFPLAYSKDLKQICFLTKLLILPLSLAKIVFTTYTAHTKLRASKLKLFHNLTTDVGGRHLQNICRYSSLDRVSKKMLVYITDQVKRGRQ